MRHQKVIKCLAGIELALNMSKIDFIEHGISLRNILLTKYRQNWVDTDTISGPVWNTDDFMAVRGCFKILSATIWTTDRGKAV